MVNPWNHLMGRITPRTFAHRLETAKQPAKQTARPGIKLTAFFPRVFT